MKHFNLSRHQVGLILSFCLATAFGLVLVNHVKASRLEAKNKLKPVPVESLSIGERQLLARRTGCVPNQNGGFSHCSGDLPQDARDVCRENGGGVEGRCYSSGGRGFRWLCEC